MENQDNQSPAKVNFFNRLWGAIKKNKDKKVTELPLSLRFIIKSAALLAHQKHLNPTGDGEYFLPLPVLEFLYWFVGVFLHFMFLRVNIAAGNYWRKKIYSIYKDLR